MALTHGGDIHAIARRYNWDWREVIDFSANINPLGPSPLVREAICGAMDRIAHYPEREPECLRHALADAWNVRQQQILLGNGATELIFFLVRVSEATRTTLALPLFSEFHRAFPTAETIALGNLETWPGSGLFVLTRPANPTGAIITLDILQTWLASSRADVLVDESFVEYSNGPSATFLIDRFPQLMILRSLTKFYALPGLRLGALIAHPDRIGSWNERREPWQVNVLAEAAAHAALRDTAHAERSLEFVTREREWLAGQVRTIPGAEPLPTSANFIFVRLAHPVSPLADHLLREKILIRDCTHWAGLTGSAIRIAVRTRRENELLLRAWRAFRSVE